MEALSQEEEIKELLDEMSFKITGAQIDDLVD
jgi:hypothetical protein